MKTLATQTITAVCVYTNAMQWADTGANGRYKENPVWTSGDRTGNNRLAKMTKLVAKGDVMGHVDELMFRDPE